MAYPNQLLVQAGIVGTLLVIWELVSRIGIVNSALLPPFSMVVERVVDLLADPRFVNDLWVTLQEVIMVFFVAVPIGVVLGILLNESEYIGSVFKPFLYYIASIPKSAFLPIFILVFGIGFTQKVAFGVLQAVPILTIMVIAAAANVPETLIRVARANGATQWQVYREIYLPSMLPLVLEGIRLGTIFAIAGVIFAEMYGSVAGIGSRITAWGQSFDIPNLMAGVLITSVLAIIVNEALRFYERRMSQWMK